MASDGFWKKRGHQTIVPNEHYFSWKFGINVSIGVVFSRWILCRGNLLRVDAEIHIDDGLDGSLVWQFIGAVP